MSDHRPVDPAKLQRQKRLEAQLRDNLKRRKAAANSGSTLPSARDRDDDRSDAPSTEADPEK